MKLGLRRCIGIGITTVMIMSMGAVLPNKVIKAATSNKDNAVAIEIGEDIKDSVTAKGEEDWYTFTTPETVSGSDSWYRISKLCSNLNEGSYGPRLYLYNNKDQELLEIDTYSANEEEEKDIRLEQKSTYYIKVVYNVAACDYRITVSELPDEAGDTLEQAANLEKNMTNRFEIQSIKDEDWFYVESEFH